MTFFEAREVTLPKGVDATKRVEHDGSEKSFLTCLESLRAAFFGEPISFVNVRWWSIHSLPVQERFTIVGWKKSDEVAA